MKKNRLFILLTLVVSLFTVSCTDLIQELFPRNIHTIKLSPLDFDWPSFSLKSSKSSNDLIAKTTTNSNNELEITFDGYGDAQVTVTGSKGEEVIVKIHVNTDDTITVDYITSGDKRDIHKDISFPGDDVLEKTTEVWKDTTTVDTTRTTKPDKSYTEDKVIKYPDKSETDIERKGNPDGSYTEKITRKSPQGTVTDELDKTVDKDGKSTTKDKDGNTYNEISPLELNIEDIDKIITNPDPQDIITIAKTPDGGIEYRGKKEGGPVIITITDKKGHPAVIKVTVNPDKTFTEEITPYYDGKKKTIPLTELTPLTGVDKIIVADPTIITVKKDPAGGTGIEITPKKPGTTTVILKDTTGTGIELTVTADVDGNVTIDEKSPYNYPTKTKTLSPEECKLPTISSVTPEKTDYATAEVKDGKLVITSTSDSGTNTSEFTVTAGDGTKKVVVITTDEEGNITLKDVKDYIPLYPMYYVGYKKLPDIVEGEKCFGQKVIKHTFDETTRQGIIYFENPITDMREDYKLASSPLIEITIPKTVEHLKLTNCSILTKVTYEDGCPLITTLEDDSSEGYEAEGVFAGTRSLVNLTLPENCTYIGRNAFSYAGIENLTAPSVKEIGKEAFKYPQNLVSIELENVEKIGEEAFSGCSKLTTVKFNKAKTIDSSFKYCSELTTAELNGLKTITGDAFKGCKKLSNLSIPELEEITNKDGVGEAFYGCESLPMDLKFPKLKKLTAKQPFDFNYGMLQQNQKKRTLYLPAIEEIGDSVTFPTIFSEVTIGPNIKTIGKGLTQNYASNKDKFIFTFEGTVPPTINDQSGNINAIKFFVVPKTAETDYKNAWEESGIPKEKIVHGPICELHYKPFWNQKLTCNIGDVPFKNSGKIILNEYDSSTNEGVLYFDDYLISMEPANSGYNKMFKDDLKEIVIPKTVTDLYGAFNGCGRLEKVEFEAGSEITEIQTGAFSCCVSLKNIILPETCTKLGQDCFYQCGFTTIEMPYVKEVNHGPFRACDSLKSLSLPDLEILRTRSICSDCESLENVILPKIKTIDACIYFSTPFTKSVTYELGENITEVTNGDTALLLESYKCTTIGAKVTFVIKTTIPPTIPSTKKLIRVYNPSAADGQFTDLDTNVVIKVPKDSVDAYKAADGWKDFAQLIVADE